VKLLKVKDLILPLGQQPIIIIITIIIIVTIDIVTVMGRQ
jgi:hypothetical protein